MNYYDVVIGAEKHWKSATFTYSYLDNLSKGTLVNVPFGSKSKVGFIVKKVTKPAFNLKELTPYNDLVIPDNTLKFMEWYQGYYAAKGGQAYGQFLPHYLTKKIPTLAQPAPPVSKPIQLNEQQKQAKKQLQSTPKPSVLHGITGSGKTRLYLSLILDTLAQNKSAVLLYPEISLTSQLINEVSNYAPVAAFHSGLTSAQRSKLWFRVATAQEPMVIAGPRSAMFLPYKDLGLIVIDEAHESTYKQDSDIRYNSILTAGGLSKAHDAKLIIGSATPPVNETELILNSGGNLVCMHRQAIANDHQKTTHIIDRKNRKLFTKHNLISDPLIESVAKSLSQNKQSLLFINRRGTAKVTLCESCGWQAECPDCELPLTYHHDLHKLICHTCGKTQRVESLCPVCENKTSLKALGSKAIVDEVQQLFPEAKIARFDTDTAKDQSFSTIYKDVRAGKVDILIGTQQIAKGLDLPLLSTVGVLDADLSLHFPDYSSDERTFQLISQVSGRVGRGHGAGTIYIQTLHPDNPVIKLATTEDWHTFRETELQNRKKHHFPPYVFAAKIIFRDKQFQKAFDKADKQKIILEKLPGLSIEGPLPSFNQKRGGFYFVQIHIKSKSRAKILAAMDKLTVDAIYDLDPTTFL